MSEIEKTMTVSIEAPNGSKSNRDNPHEYYKNAYANIVTKDGIILQSEIYVDTDGVAFYQMPNLNMSGYSFNRRPYDALMAMRLGYANAIVGDTCVKAINSKDFGISGMRIFSTSDIQYTNYLLAYIGSDEYAYVSVNDEHMFCRTDQLSDIKYSMICVPHDGFMLLLESCNPVTFIAGMPTYNNLMRWEMQWNSIKSWKLGQALLYTDDNLDQLPVNPLRTCQEQISELMLRIYGEC